MKNFSLIIIFTCILVACEEKYEEKMHYPSHAYKYIHLDTAQLARQQTVYVPVYSHIYIKNGKYAKNLTATLSIRSTNFYDSVFVLRVDYYGSDGKLIKKYLDSTLVVNPMSSAEFIVGEEEDKGGAGANFIVEWGTRKPVSAPLIQAVMLGTYYNTGISFIANGVDIQK